MPGGSSLPSRRPHFLGPIVKSPNRNTNLNRRSGHHHGIRSWCDAVHRSTHRSVLRMRLALTTTTTGTPDGNRRTPRISGQTISTHCCTSAKRSRSASSMAGAGGIAGNRRPIRQVGGPPRALLRKRACKRWVWRRDMSLRAINNPLLLSLSEQAAATGRPDGDALGHGAPICCTATIQDEGMPEIEGERGWRVAERSHRDWRIVASAWVVAIVCVLLFAAADASASRHRAASRQGNLAGAVIPRHDPSFPGPDELAASDWVERQTAEARF